MKKSIRESKDIFKNILDYFDTLYKSLEKDMRNGILSKDQYVHTSELLNEIYDVLSYCSDEDVNNRFTDSANGFDDFIYEINENNDNWFDFLVPFVKDFEIFRDDLYAMSSLYESKKENKDMKKSIRERFDPPKDWDFEEMVEQYGMEYLSESNPDVEPYPMDEFNELTSYQDDPLEAITRAFYGGRYGFKNDSFSPMDMYFAYDGYANLISIGEYLLTEYLTDHIDEPYFYDWCVDNGYFEVEEDDE